MPDYMLAIHFQCLDEPQVAYMGRFHWKADARRDAIKLAEQKCFIWNLTEDKEVIVPIHKVEKIEIVEIEDAEI